MEWFKEIFNQLSTIFKWWVIVLPWENGLRIRLGKKVKVLKAGLHFRIPYVDSCYVQPVRLEFLALHPQTLTTKDNHTITIAVQVAYTISDIFKTYNSVSAINLAVSGKVMGVLSEFVCTNESKNVTPKMIEETILNTLAKLDWGISVKEVKIVTFAVVKTFRLIQDGHWTDRGDKLDKKV